MSTSFVTETGVLMKLQLLAHVHAPRGGDGDLLHLGRTVAVRHQETLLPLPLGESNRRETCIWNQDLVHVCPDILAERPPLTDAHSSFVGVLFIDAFQRMIRVAAEADLAKTSGSGVQDVRSETNFAARKF